MGIKQSGGNIKTTNVRYSAFLGMLYLSNPETEALVAEAKALVGESEVKKGYSGNTGATAQARAFLRDKGVSSVKIEGTLTSAKVRFVETAGRKNAYLNVCVRDNDGRYCMSVPMGNEGTQLLVRKLVNAQPGAHTEIGIFATMGEPKPDGRQFAEHGASLVQDGKQVSGISPKPIQGLVETAINALKEAGVDDKDILNSRRKLVATKFHVDVMEDVEKKFTDYYEARRAASGEAPEASDADHVPAQPAANEEDPGFDVSDLMPAEGEQPAERQRVTA